MKVALNGRFLSQRVTGVQRHARELVRAIDGLLQRPPSAGPALELSLLVPSNGELDLELRRIEIRRVGRLGGQLWEQLELPFHSRGSLLLNLANTAPTFGPEQIVVIQDASVFTVPEAYSAAFGGWYRLMLPRWASRARLVLTNSEFSRADLVRWLRIPSEKIRVIGCGHEHILRISSEPGVLTRHRLGARPYVLAVSSLSRHKNLEAVAAAIQLLGPAACDFALAGPTNPRVFGHRPEAGPASVVQLGYVSDGELRALYEQAACLVYPSRYEGFGIPPLEAMACGCPVIASRAASLPEVCGDAVLYVDPEDPRQLAAAIRRVLCEEGLADELRRRGRERATRWTWARSAIGTLAAVREALAR
jgi:glycosyltransferase involved in cell wall biosynthesis